MTRLIVTVVLFAAAVARAPSQSGELVLATSATEVSASAGGFVHYELGTTENRGGGSYSLMMAFNSGTFEFGNSTVPIALDALSFHTFFHGPPPPLASQRFDGALPPLFPRAGALLGVPPGALVGLEGLVIHLAAVTWDPFFFVTDSSNAVTLTITP